MVGTLGLIFAGFFAFVRPWYRNWGATAAEAARTLPGDEIVPGAMKQETRAITIGAPVDRVWPWLAQIGQDRGGFYSFDLLENLAGCEMPADDRLRPELQSWKLGDKLWMYPPGKAGGSGFAVLRVHVPGRALGFGTHAPGTPPEAEDGSWSFILEPVDAGSTRLFIRGRGPAYQSLGWAALDRSIFEPMHFVMERGMMAGLKARAEGSAWPRVGNHVQIALWTLVLTQFLAAAALVLLRRHWGRALAGLLLSAAAFQILTLVQPPLAAGIGIVLVLVALPWWPRGSRKEDEPCLKES